MKSRLNKSRFVSLFIITLLCTLMFITPLTIAQDDSDDNPGARAAIVVKDEIPQIKPEIWTSFNVSVIDMYDLDWNALQDAGYSKLKMYAYWPIIFGIPEIGRYLGYTSLELQAEVVDSKGLPAEGWSADCVPSTIEETTTNIVSPIEVRVKPHRLEVDYAVSVRIKATRIDTWGDEDGYTYYDFFVKAYPLNYIEIDNKEFTRTVAPKSITNLQFQITNRGYYEDIFRFEIRSKNNNIKALVDSQGLFIKPGEKKTISLQVMAPENIWDPGTPHKLDVYTWSRLNQTKTYIGTLVVITEGFFIPLPLIFAVVLVLIIIVFLFLFFKKRELFYKINIFSRFRKKKKEKKKKSKKEKKIKSFIKKRKKTSKPPEKEIVKNEEPEENIVEFEETDEKQEKEFKKEKPKVDKKKQKELDKIRKKQEKQKRKLL